MLIGFQLSDLSLRSKLLLVVAVLLLGAGLLLLWLQPEPALRLLRVFLLAILALGAYWLSFLADAGSRLSRTQAVVATAFAVLPWLLLLALVFAFPQVLVDLWPRGR